MGAWNYLWHFIFSLFLCTRTRMTEGRNLTTVTAQVHVNGSVSTDPDRTNGLAANNSNATVAEPNATTARSLLDTSFLSPSTMRMVGGEGRTVTESTRPNGAGTSLWTSARSDVVSPDTPTTGPGTAATGTGPGSGTASSVSLRPSSTVTSPSLSSPVGSKAATPSPQRSSSGGTTAHPSTTLVISRTVASTSGTSPATGTTKASFSSTLGGSMEASADEHTSTTLTQRQATPSSVGSPLPSTTMASIAMSATTPPSKGESPTMSQGRETTTKLNVETAHSLPATSLVSRSTMRTAGGEGRTETTMPVWEGSSLRVSAGSSAMSPAIPTTGPDTTATSMGAEGGIASSPPQGPSLAVTSHSSSSPVGSTGVTPSLQRNSSSSSTEEHLATTSHPPTAPTFSPVSSIAGVTAEVVTPSPAPSTPSTNPVASASSPSPASDTTEASLSPTPVGSTETSAAQHTSTPLTQGQATVESGTTPSSMGSLLPSTATASIANSATTPPGEGGGPTINLGSGTTNHPSAGTSRSLPDTSLATPSTPNLNISTSVNPSVTGTCSPITLSIQLENVTSTMIQFSWKPQGGTGDSPYTVLLRGKSGEMEKKILNGTSTAFENLLSGHQYQISVDVSTCSKNVSTSLTVQTAAEVYSGTTRITNKEFKPEYQNKSSKEFQEFETNFTAEITKHLPQGIQELKNGTKMRIVINSIENGSVIVLFDIVLDVGQNITKPEISDAFTKALNMSTEFKVDPRKTVIEARNSCQPDLNDCSQNAACTAEGATYSCQCKEGFTDNSPQVPGRVCQQDLPSQQTTTVPPETNTTGSTEQTTPVPPETNTTGVTTLTTPVPPETNTTGVTAPTTPVPPETNTTGVTTLTTPVLPETNTTGVTAPTTPVLPETNTTGVTAPTTPVPPETNTTGVTAPTTPVLPETNTTGSTEQTTTVPPETNTSGVTTLTTPVPPETNTTGDTEQTTPVLPETNTTGVTAPTTPVPPKTNTTGVTAPTTPVLPETNTTGFTGSTSNSIFTTTFPSPPCMPVSIEIQDVTGEEIQLSWTGGSTGSLYNISLMDGKQEINKTITKETKAVFKHLLPAHVYTISVGVSSCAENNWTSVTVRTGSVSCFNRTVFCIPENTGCSGLKSIVCSDNQAFGCSVLLKNQTFNNTLYNSDSEEYKAMAESIKTDVVREMRLELKDERFDIAVLGFRPGSVVVDFISLLPKEEPVDVNVIQTRLSQILKRKFGDETELTVQTLSVQSPTDNISGWRVAVIVLGVLLGVALVLILLAIIFYIYMRKRWGKYLVEPQDPWESLSKSTYKMHNVSFTHLE